MRTHTFCYDDERAAWAETHVPAFCATDDGELPVVLLVDYYEASAGETRLKVWCGEHQACEGIAGRTEDGVVTDKGCRLTGITVRVENTEYLTSTGDRRCRESGKNTRERDIRWQVQYEPGEKQVVLVNHDAAIGFDWKMDGETGGFVNVPFVHAVNRHCWVLRPGAVKPEKAVPYTEKSKNGASSLFDPPWLSILPPSVASAALSLLSEAAESVWGFRPPLLLPPDTGKPTYWRQNNAAAWVEAFLARPLDMNIYFFRKYFETAEEFDRRFPPDRRENFPPLCEALGVEPDDALRDAYRENPAYFVARIVLSRLGIHEESLLQRFRGVPAFCGEDMRGWYGRPLLYPGDDAEHEEEWEALRFYSAWRLRSEAPEAFIGRLLSTQRQWKGWRLAGMVCFQKHFDAVPKEWREEILQDGLTFRAYERLILLDHARSAGQPALSYGEKERARECKISGYNFRLMNSVPVFRRLAGGYRILEDMEYVSGRTALYVMERNGQILYYILLEDDAVQWSHPRLNIRPPLAAKIEIAFLFWKRRFGLTERWPEDAGRFCESLPEAVVGPVGVDKWKDSSLLDMLDSSKSEVRRGYYLSFYRKLAEVRLLKTAPPRADEDERARLTYDFPCCRGIFDAAWAGDPEAQYVMSLIYRDENFFTHCDARRSAVWYGKACENGWRDVMPDKEDVSLDGLSTPQEDRW